MPGTGFKRRPYTDPGQIERGEHIPVMDGRHVFKMATTHMIEVAQEILARNGVAPADLKMVLMHQANKRINEYCQKALGIPDSKVLHNIGALRKHHCRDHPLLWDEAARARDRGRPRAARRLRGGNELGRHSRSRVGRGRAAGIRSGQRHLGAAMAASLGLQRDQGGRTGIPVRPEPAAGRKRLIECRTRKIAKATIRKLTIALMNRP